jgi:cytochrome d ubiquinol oxidase subunit II
MELNIVWFILLVVLFSGYVILDGFDLGVGMNFFKAKTDEERRILLNSIGPVWDGNEVWLITAGGALFAAFPNVYATVFSGFYTALILVLLVLIGRVVAIEFRSKDDRPGWRNFWDVVFLISSYLITLLLGVALGNIVAGVPIVEINGVKEFGGTFFTLLRPYTIFYGLTAVIALKMHGLYYASIKTEGELNARIKKSIPKLTILFLVFYLIQMGWTFLDYTMSAANFINHNFWFVLPVITIASLIIAMRLSKMGKAFAAFIFTSLSLLMGIATVGVGIFPNLLIASNNPANSLTIFTDASSPGTLMTMLVIACIFVPIVLIYKFFVYRIFKGKVKLDSSSY